MSISLPSIGLIFVGGHVDVQFQNSNQYQQWTNDFAPLQFIVHPTPYFISTRSSTAHYSLHGVLQQVIETLQRHRGEHIGFVVLLPDQDFLYAANFLSFSLGSVDQPIVCVAPQLSAHQPHYIDSILRYKHTILQAAAVAGSEVTGTVLVLDQSIVPVTHTTLTTHGWQQRVTAVDQLRYGHIGLTPNILLHPPTIQQRPAISSNASVVPLHWQTLATTPLLSNQLLTQLTTPSSAPFAVIDAHTSDHTATMLQTPASVPTLLVTAQQAMVTHQKQSITFQLSPMAAIAKWFWTIGNLVDHQTSFTKIVDWMSRPVADEYFSSSNYERLHL